MFFVAVTLSCYSSTYHQAGTRNIRPNGTITHTSTRHCVRAKSHPLFSAAAVPWSHFLYSHPIQSQRKLLLKENMLNIFMQHEDHKAGFEHRSYEGSYKEDSQHLLPRPLGASDDSPGQDDLAPKQQRARKVVRFSDIVDIIPESHSISKQNRKAVFWYQREDYDNFKLDIYDTMHAVFASKEKLTAIDSDQICIRGFEYYLSRDTFERRRRNRVMLTRMVMMRQNLHRMAGRPNPEAISSISRSMSRNAKREAAALGRNDFNTLLRCWSPRAA